MNRRGKKCYFFSGDFSVGTEELKKGGDVKKIWAKQEEVVGVDGKPFAVKAGLFEQLKAARELQERIREGNQNRAKVLRRINSDERIV